MCAPAWTYAHAGQSAAGEQPPVIRAATRLVIVNAVVHDKTGAPVNDLTLNDFALFDDGQEETISVFSVEVRSALPPPPPRLPPNVFSNQRSIEGGVPTNVAAIVLDGLGTNFADIAQARNQLVKFLRQIQPQDRVAVYLLGKQLYLLQDFNDDPSALVEAIEREQHHLPIIPGPAAVAAKELDAPVLGWDNTAGKENSRSIQDETNQAKEIWRSTQDETNQALKTIADHLSGLPGRKSIIWLTGGSSLPFSPRIEDYGLVNDRIMATARILNDSNVAIYPIDARGLYTNPIFDASQSLDPLQPTPSFISRIAMLPILGALRGPIEAMIDYADWTGGRAFYNTNNLAGAIRTALDDSEVSYTLGYYPSQGQWDGRFHTIKVQVKRKGVEARYRNGYSARGGGGGVPVPDRHAALASLMQNPVEATGIAVTVGLRPLNPVHADEFEVTIIADPQRLTFHQENGRWVGSFDFVAGQYSDQESMVRGVDKALKTELKEKTYEKVRREGLSLTFPLSIEPGATELRVAACDNTSGAVGSVRIPLSKVSSTLSPPAEVATRPLRGQPSGMSRTETWRMAGRVASPSNEPLAGVSVQFELANGNLLGPVVETNPEGLFEALVPIPVGEAVNGIPVGSPLELRVIASKSGYKPAREDVEPSADSAPRFDLVLQDNGRRAALLTPEALINAVSRQLVPPGSPAPLVNDIYRQGAEELLRRHQTLGAIPLLRNALDLDPSCSGCKFLLGLAHFDAGDWEEARAHLTEAAGLNNSAGSGNKLPGPLVSLAVLDMWQGDWESAERLVKMALEASPGDGLALQEAGRLAMSRQDWVGAETTLRDAVHKGAPPEVHLLLARLDLDQDDVKGAKNEYQQYLSKLPPTRLRGGGINPQARAVEHSPAALEIRDELRDRTQLNSYGKTKTMVTRPLAELLSEIPELKRIEPAPNQEPLASLLHNVGNNVEKYVSEVPNTFSDESLHEERLGEKGQIEASRERSYGYLLLVHAGHLPSTEEYRTNPSGKEVREEPGEGFSATRGFAVLLMMFHPAYQPETDFRLLGRQSIAGHETQVVAFAQRPKESHFVMHLWIGRSSFPCLHQGIAWVDTQTFQIVWLRSDLLRPLDQVGLKRVTASIQFAETRVEGAPATFWLPQRVTVFIQYNNRFYRNEHTYSHFRLFASETRIGAVVATPQ
jgi:VWFA-related protein